MTVVRDTLAGFNTGLAHYAFGPGPGVLAGCGEPLRSQYLVAIAARRETRRLRVHGTRRRARTFTRAEPDSRRTACERTQILRHRRRQRGLPERTRRDTGSGSRDAGDRYRRTRRRARTPFRIARRQPSRGVPVRRRRRVPADHIIGRPGEGLPRAMRQIGDTRLLIAAEAVGLARWAIEFTTAHLKSPHHSGEPLGAREGVRLRYADLRIRTYAARSMLYRTARLGESPVQTSSMRGSLARCSRPRR